MPQGARHEDRTAPQREGAGGRERVRSDDTIAATARLLGAKRRGLALVTDADGQLLGVLSALDILRALGDHEGSTAALPVSRAMNADVCTCGRAESVETALEMMAQRRIRHLPVVEDGALKGMVGIRDLLEARFADAELEARELKDYVFGLGYR